MSATDTAQAPVGDAQPVIRVSVPPPRALKKTVPMTATPAANETC